MKNIIIKIYRNHNTDAAALLLRLIIGVTFIAAGWIKLSSMDMTIGFFQTMGFSPFEAYLTTWVELIAGILVILGFLQKPATVALAVIMAVTVWGLPPEPMNFMFGHNYNFTLLVVLVVLYFLGAGKYSIAGLREKRRN